MDAAAGLLLEQGERGVMMHSVAARANASTGSMYHLFRNREELLEALFRRHTDALGRLAPSYALEDARLWRHMSAREAVDRLFGYAFSYFAVNADALSLLSLKENPRFPDFEAVVEVALTFRLEKEAAPTIARTLVAISTGTLLYLQNLPAAERGSVITSLPAALAAYLAEQDAVHSSADNQI
nr:MULTISPECIES: TetR/AcrR family transcriptional regulator [unclassified Sphingomonas]